MIVVAPSPSQWFRLNAWPISWAVERRNFALFVLLVVCRKKFANDRRFPEVYINPMVELSRTPAFDSEKWFTTIPYTWYLVQVNFSTHQLQGHSSLPTELLRLASSTVSSSAGVM